MRKASEDRKDRHIEHLASIQRLEVGEKSRTRAGSVVGPWIRRFLVVSMVFAVIIAPFVIAVFTDKSTVFQYTESPRGFFAGLFGRVSEHYHFEPLKGYVLSSETRQALMAVIAFYFGQGAAK